MSDLSADQVMRIEAMDQARRLCDGRGSAATTLKVAKAILNFYETGQVPDGGGVAGA